MTGSVIMGNTLMQHRLAIAGFKMPGMKVSWRKRMNKFKNTTREERAGRKLQAEARQGMKRLTTLVILPLVCVLPLLWMSALRGRELLHSILPLHNSFFNVLPWGLGFGQGKNISKHKFMAEGCPDLPCLASSLN